MIYSKETVNNITSEEFKEYFKTFRRDAILEHLKLKNLKEESDLNDYKDDKFFISFFEAKSMQSDNFVFEDLEDTLEILQDFKSTSEVFKSKRGFSITQYSNVYDDFLEEIYFTASWVEVRDILVDSHIESSFKDYVKNWLKPEGSAEYTRGIDCKMLSLFKSGHIDWNTLRTLTYTDCDV